MTENKLRHTEGDGQSQSQSQAQGHNSGYTRKLEGIKVVLQTVFGTNAHVEAKEERERASAAIMRMTEEAEKMNSMRPCTCPIEDIEDALKALAKDL